MQLTPFQRYQQYGLAEPIRLPTPATTLSWIVFGCAAFGIIGVVLFFNAEDIWEQIMALLCVVFTGVVGAVVVPPLMRGNIIAAFDRDGLYTRRYDVKVLWSDIKTVGVAVSGEYESLCITVHDYEKYRARIPWQAAWMRVYCRNLWARSSSVSLIAVMDPLSGKDLLDAFSELQDFDFFLSHYEFPSMSMNEVKEIIEAQTRLTQGRMYDAEMERTIMQDENKIPPETQASFPQPPSPPQAERVPSREPFAIPGFVRHAEAAGDCGGGEWYVEAMVELLADRVRVAEYKNQKIDKTEEIFLDDISEIRLIACPKEGEYGCLKLTYKKKSLWDYLLKLFPFEVHFTLAQEAGFRQLSELIRQRKPESYAAQPAAYSPPSGAGQSFAQPAPTKASTPSLSELEVLNKLAEMKEKGILSEDEFNAKKKQILGL